MHFKEIMKKNFIQLGIVASIVFTIVAAYIVYQFIYAYSTGQFETKDDDKDISQTITRDLTTTEITFFNQYFLDNTGFIANFYDSPSNLSIINILTKDFTSFEPTTLTANQIETIRANNSEIEADNQINLALAGPALRDIFTNRTGEEYDNEDEPGLWSYSTELDVYYNYKPYGIESDFNNYYTFEQLEITDNHYVVDYTAYYKPATDSPDYDSGNPDYKKQLYEGMITLIKISDDHYHFYANVKQEQ